MQFDKVVIFRSRTISWLALLVVVITSSYERVKPSNCCAMLAALTIQSWRTILKAFTYMSILQCFPTCITLCQPCVKWKMKWSGRWSVYMESLKTSCMMEKGPGVLHFVVLRRRSLLKVTLPLNSSPSNNWITLRKLEHAPAIQSPSIFRVSPSIFSVSPSI